MAQQVKTQVQNVVDVTLLEYSRQAMRRYGLSVIEERALPDFRDGLKPVQRKIAWAMYKLGLRSTAPIVKSARIVGDTIGKFHPHGDTACYGAMVTMANLSEPIVDGHGNWGGMFDEAAAYRYTNAKLTKYSDHCFFAPEYIRIAQLVPNYDGKDVEPVILPSLLPNLLLNGSTGIAVATTSNIPPFKLEGVAKLVKGVLGGKKLTPQICMKVLEFNYKYGGEVYIEEPEYRKELLQFYKTGIGSATFVSPHKWDANKRTMTFTSFAPNLNVLNALSKIREDFSEVQNIEDATSIESGVCFIITLKKSVSSAKLNEVRENISVYLESTQHYKTNVTERYLENGEPLVKFRTFNIPDLITEWCDWRTELELKMLKNELLIQQKDIDRTNLLLLAQKNRALIAKSWEADDQDKFIMKALKIDAEQTKVVLSLTQRSLGKLDRSSLLKKLEDQRKMEKQIKSWIKDPKAKIVNDINKLLKV